MSFEPRLLEYVWPGLPDGRASRGCKIVLSDLVTPEFRGRKPGTEFPLSLDVLEYSLHQHGYSETDYAFLPDATSLEKMLAENNPLLTLGARGQRPWLVKTARIWGVNMMNYLQSPAFFALLRLANVPARRNERDERSPLIVLGGHIWPNPLPLASFYDVMVVGDGEETLVEIARLAEEFHADRPGLLAALAQLEGVYVPGHTRRPVRRATIDFQNPAYVAGSSYLYNGTGAVLPSRGCAYACAFCNNSLVGGDYRIKPAGQIKAHVDLLARAGARTIVPLAASNSVYQSEEQDFFEIAAYIQAQNVAVKILSDRPEKLTKAHLRANLEAAGKLILAPEASPRLRQGILQKTIHESALGRAIEVAITAGISRIQLYVILAIPPVSPGVVDFLPEGFNGEQPEDLRYLADLAISIVTRMENAGLEKPAGKPYVFMDCMAFIPAIGTQLQKAAFLPYQEYAARLAALQALIPAKYKGLIEVSAALDEYTHLLQMFLERATAQAGDALWQVWQASAGELLTVADIRRAAQLTGVSFSDLTVEFSQKPLPYEGLIKVQNGRTCRPAL